LNRVTEKLTAWGYNVCVVCLLDSNFITDSSRFISGTLTCLAAMMQLALPHINVLTKCDLLEDKKKSLDKFFNPSMKELLEDLNNVAYPKLRPPAPIC
jgi:GPN-loop GTPase